MFKGITNVFERQRKKGLGQKACRAAQGGDFLSALGFLDQGAEVNFIGRETTYSESVIDASVAHYALSRANMTAFKALVERGLDVNLTLKEDKKSLLLLALEKGSDEAAIILVERGASLDVRTPALETPLDIARRKKTEPGMAAVVQAIETRLQEQVQRALPAGGQMALAADTSALQPLVLKKQPLQL